MAQSSRVSDEEEWNGEKDTLLNDAASIRRPSSSPLRAALTTIALILATNLATAVVTHYHTKSSTIAAYSPDHLASKAYPTLDRSLAWTNFSNHRLNVTSRWSAPPSPDVDHAWNELGVKDQLFLLPERLGREVYGLDPRRHVFAPDDALGRGVKGGFGVFVQGLHDMHCLNELRRALYFNKPYYRRFEDDRLTPEWSRVSHIRHCLDNIRERIMCSADVAVIPDVWLNHNETYPLFRREHKCYSYDALMDWFRAWHDGDQAKQIDWTVQIHAPHDAIFTQLD